MTDDQRTTEWWTFWGGPACGERSVRVAAALAPSDPEANPPEHLRIIPTLDATVGHAVLQVHRYVAAPWPPPAHAAEQQPHWRYVGMTIDA